MVTAAKNARELHIPLLVRAQSSIALLLVGSSIIWRNICETYSAAIVKLLKEIVSLDGLDLKSLSTY